MMRSIFLTLLVATAATAFVPIAPITRSSSALNVAIDTSDIKNGLTVEIDGEPYKVLSFSIMKQARGAAKTTIKFKNLQKGNTIENTYRSGEKFETAMIEKRQAQFTYKDEVRCLFVGWLVYLLACSFVVKDSIDSTAAAARFY